MAKSYKGLVLLNFILVATIHNVMCGEIKKRVYTSTEKLCLSEDQLSEIIGEFEEILEDGDLTADEKLELITETLEQELGIGGEGGGMATNFVQWGRSDCPHNARIIYEGVAAKSYYTHGGGSNFLCLPSEPEFPTEVLEGKQSQSYIYGVEYMRANSPFIDTKLDNNDVPCAVCEVLGKNQVLMIPAKEHCPRKWTLEYEGILMSQMYNHKGSDFICVARDMEATAGSQPKNLGGLLYVVEAVCGSLPCPPYQDGYEIACVVCTR